MIATKVLWGVFCILLGALFMLDNVLRLRLDFDFFWPLLIIFLGLHLLLRIREKRQGGQTEKEPKGEWV